MLKYHCYQVTLRIFFCQMRYLISYATVILYIRVLQTIDFMVVYNKHPAVLFKIQHNSSCHHKVVFGCFFVVPFKRNERQAKTDSLQKPGHFHLEALCFFIHYGSGF